jgi:hypothetical protein
MASRFYFSPLLAKLQEYDMRLDPREGAQLAVDRR